jgi:hypothetical protein
MMQIQGPCCPFDDKLGEAPSSIELVDECGYAPEGRGSLRPQGLQQPFQDAYETARNQVVAGTIAAGVAGLLGGFLIGRYVGRGDGRAR